MCAALTDSTEEERHDDGFLGQSHTHRVLGQVGLRHTECRDTHRENRENVRDSDGQQGSRADRTET